MKSLKATEGWYFVLIKQLFALDRVQERGKENSGFKACC